MVDISKEAEQNIAQLQMLEQNIQNTLSQKQHYQSQIYEIDSALKELEGTKDSYKIIGNIMVRTDKKELTDDLKNKKDVAELRIKTLEKQENSLREKAQKIQQDVLKVMKEKEKK